MSGFECKQATLPAVTAVLLDSSVVLLRELYLERGDGPWVDDLHAQLTMSIKNQDFEGIPAEAEREHVEAGLEALNAVFSTAAEDAED